MYFQTSTIQILEKCITDKDIKCIYTLKTPSLDCVELITETMIKIVDLILNMDQFNKYPKMKIVVYKTTLDLINNSKTNVINKIEELIYTEESYIWTECPIFHKEYKELINNEKIALIDKTVVNNIKNIINIYFTTLKNTFRNLIPKIIMYNLINNVMKKLNYTLTEDLINNDLLDLLEEDNTIYKKRQSLNIEKTNILEIKKIL
jgi:hypothetical protein